jgi:succinylglutamate desuccinylase
MTIIPALTKIPFLTLVACIHGDELFGRDVFEYLKQHHSEYPYVQLILAHEEAITAGKRFIETDLNRSFPGSPTGSLEERLAHELLPHVRSSSYVLDLHTTSSPIRMTPIVTCLSQATRKILPHVPSKEIAFVQQPLGAHAFIGQLINGVSLEYNEEYAKTREALAEALNIIRSLNDKEEKEVSTRDIYFVDGVIPLAVELPVEAENFSFVEKINGYPFLLHERSYPTIQGLCASFKIEIVM